MSPVAKIVVTVVGLLIGLGALALLGSALLIALLVTGGPDVELTCTDPLTDSTRTVTSSPALADALQGKLDALNDQLDAGSGGTFGFDESEASSRALRFVVDEGIAVSQVVICLHEGNVVEGKGEIKIEELLPGAGFLGGSVKAKADVTIDLSGENPKIGIANLEAGSVPGFLTGLMEGALESAINSALDETTLDHNYEFSATEITATFGGTP
jgi:hypothetical protein